MCAIHIVIVLLITACSPATTLPDKALQHNLVETPIETHGFTLHSFSKQILSTGDDLHIYLGGDGLPWQDSKPAANPTGRKNLTIDLLIADPGSAIYLTRPCYQLNRMPAACHTELWTSARYSELIVMAIADAISQLVDDLKPASVTVIGYSGGGVLALLAAAKLDPQPKVITVASNLDIDAWTAFHDHLPLSGSLNPLLELDSQRGSQHIHLIGGKDRVVPPSTITRYRATHPQARYQYFEEFDHQCCWVQHWSDILVDATSGARL